ncbi:fibroblast growth factor 10-like [Clytia hemisphaerica]|uniref:fibroblast growth factor 10-like n=1 Tax=Clytia hemisphaerica TaxID=252671 RepID=UPI0034D4CCAE
MVERGGVRRPITSSYQEESARFASAENEDENEMGEVIKQKLMKFTRPRKLRSKDILLAIQPNGEITSTKDPDNPYALLQVISISANMIAMWGKEAQLYMAVNELGQVYATETEGRDCVFVECFTPEFYNTYESYHSINHPTAKYYLTLPTPGELVQMTHDITQTSTFYWEVPQLHYSNILPSSLPMTTKNSNNNTRKMVKNVVR